MFIYHTLSVGEEEEEEEEDEVEDESNDLEEDTDEIDTGSNGMDSINEEDMFWNAYCVDNDLRNVFELNILSVVKLG